MPDYRPPRRPSHVDSEEIDVSWDTDPSVPIRQSHAHEAGRYAVLRPDLEEKLTRVLKNVESIPPMAGANIELLKLQHAAQLDGQRRDLAAERVLAHLAALENRLKKLEDGTSGAVSSELDRIRGSQAHWVRYVVAVAVTLVTGAILLAVGRLLR